MGLIAKVSPGGGTVSIRVKGHFDMRFNKELCEIVKDSLGTATRYVIDLGETERLYDSGLGMLMHLRCLIGEDRIDIVGCSPEIRNKLAEYEIKASGPVEETPFRGPLNRPAQLPRKARKAGALHAVPLRGNR